MKWANRGGQASRQSMAMVGKAWRILTVIVLTWWGLCVDGVCVEKSSGLGYAGSWWSSSLQSYDLRARWYEPHAGRFVSPDSFEGVASRPASLHRYAYAEGDPINRADPGGHSSISDVLLSGQVRAYLATQQGGPLVTSAKLGLGVLTLSAAVHDPESFLSAMESPSAAMELAANNIAFVAHYGRRSAEFVSGYIAARWQMQPVVEETLMLAAQRIRRLDPNAVVGFRGSMARGYKGAHKGNDPFNSAAFDVDGFIVSDSIAMGIPVGRVGGRFVNATAPAELLSIQASVDQSLRAQLNGLKPQRFTFRVFTTREFLKRQGDAVVIQP